VAFARILDAQVQANADLKTRAESRISAMNMKRRPRVMIVAGVLAILFAAPGAAAASIAAPDGGSSIQSGWCRTC
jgi:hypothetical protein